MITHNLSLLVVVVVDLFTSIQLVRAIVAKHSFVSVKNRF